ncbi:hypothetical protein ABIC09_007357 [Bradyrhizobium sp. S3.12.5]|uniref:hypothetical protein n=1 Tax=Bradyrhizobium sp. S3.12.5 TaxID=3156386 RepID=UPI003392D5CF
MALADAKAAAERAEAAVRAVHTHLTEALDVIPEGLAVFDKDDRLVPDGSQHRIAQGFETTKAETLPFILQMDRAHSNLAGKA